QCRAAAVTLAQNNLRQRDRRAGTRVNGERFDLTHRSSRTQENTANRSVAGDSEMGQKIETQAVQFGASQQPHVGLAVAQGFSAVHWQVESEIEHAFLGAMKKSPNQRPCIQVTDSR